MNCPNCTEALEEKAIVKKPWEIMELATHLDSAFDISKFYSDLMYSLWICPHCRCIVLRCEE